jgi:hypothetical protein
VTSQGVVEFLILLSVIPAILGPLLYGFSGPWWESLTGIGLMIGWSGLGLLVVWAAAFVLWGDDFPYRDAIRLVVFALISAGLWVKLIALVIVRYRTWRGDLV